MEDCIELFSIITPLEYCMRCNPVKGHGSLCGLEQKRLPVQRSDWSLQYLKERWREDRFFLLRHHKRQWTEVVAREIPLGQKKTYSRGGLLLARVPRKTGECASLGML